MKALPCLLASILLAAAPAGAQLILLSAEASLEFELSTDPSPTPVCVTQWLLRVGEGQTIHYEEVRTDEPCHAAWLVHACADSVVVQASWPELNPTDPIWTQQSFASEVTLEIELTERTRFTVVREMTGQLDVGLQSVEWLPPIGGPAAARVATRDTDLQVDLDPGGYRLKVWMSALELGTHFAYSGSMHVTWSDAPLVTTEGATWGAVRTLFR